jgi:hypothetical protein
MNPGFPWLCCVVRQHDNEQKARCSGCPGEMEALRPPAGAHWSILMRDFALDS